MSNTLKLAFFFFLVNLFSVYNINAQSLYWLDASFSAPAVGTSLADGSGVITKQLTAQSLPEGLTWSPTNSTLFWSELAFTSAGIRKSGTIFSSQAPLVFSGGSVLRGVAFDVDSNWIYFASSNLIAKPHIERIHPDGSSHEIVLQLDSLTGNPRAIAIDLVARNLYWTEFSQGKIRRLNLSPGAVPEDVVVGLAGPIGLAVDPAGQKIYWIEANANVLKRSNKNGSGIEVLVQNLASPNYLAIDTLGGKLYWTEIGTPRIRKANLDGSSIETLPIDVLHPTGILFTSTTPTSVSKFGAGVPLVFSLNQNYPNPFNPTTTITFSVGAYSHTSLRVYDVLGREVATIVSEDLPVGTYARQWNASNLPSGVYFYRLQAGSFTETKKLVLLK
jgi:DNA-binding beta-propeller fold protein YncE